MRLSSAPVELPPWSYYAWKWAEACLWAVGCAALGYCGYVLAQAWLAQTGANRALDRSLHVLEARSVPARPALQAGALVGRIEMPRLAMSSIIFEGFDSPVLERGVGHLSGSALPGENGNVVLAAHRDTFFRPLRNVREGDLVNVTTEDGVKAYRVESTRIVQPEEVSVMSPTADAELTLITCYPFNFFGHAPERFIVRARAVTVPPPPEVSTTAATAPLAPKPHRIKARARQTKVATRVLEKRTPPAAPKAAPPLDPSLLLTKPTPSAPLNYEPDPPSETPASASDNVPPPPASKHKRSWNPLHLLHKIPQIVHNPEAR